MKEIERLEMLVKHYEDKEKRLIKWIKEYQEVAKANIKISDNYSVKLAWKYYNIALRAVLKRIEVFERSK